ncbi:MAG: tRNA (guanosine(37)-N1)-methyltransferase TrmD [Gammaproteobacteria bacterium]|nr:tRNA (guanosine(37)-N1)-methyltransferase TrmD [Gammaproteobacteria bacterium]
MDIHVISIFPEMFRAVTEYGVVGRAIKQKVLSLSLHNPRDFAVDKHSTVDDRPYGGGPGMVMIPEPMFKVIEAAKAAAKGTPRVVYLSPQGQRFNHLAARRFCERESVILLAGRYEGIDERVLSSCVDEEWSIGDYVLSGGELAAMVMIDAVARLLPSSLGNSQSAVQDSFVQGLLDCPHYTRPENYADQAVPGVLLSGDHEDIARWRMKQSLGRTWLRRPDLLNKIDLTDEQHRLLKEFKTDINDGTQ